MTDAAFIEDEVAKFDDPQSTALAIRPDRPVIIDPAIAFLPVPWRMIEEAAELISTCPGLAKQFADPANCRFVAYQAARWGMDPVAVATKTYFTESRENGTRVGYEAQLIHALVESDPALLEPLDFQFGYAGNTKQAQHRFCTVAGRLRARDGTEIIRKLTTPTVAQIKVKKSPLWTSDVDQQLGYSGSRSWARRFRPGRILGVYSSDEMDALAEFDSLPRRALFEEDEAPPPETGDNIPAGIEDARAWAAGEQSRILTMTDPSELEKAWLAMTDHDLGKMLVAYDRPVMDAIKASISRRKAELKGNGKSGKAADDLFPGDRQSPET